MMMICQPVDQRNSCIRERPRHPRDSVLRGAAGWRSSTEESCPRTCPTPRNTTLITYYSLLITHYPLLYSLLTTIYSLPSTYYSLLSTHWLALAYPFLQAREDPILFADNRHGCAFLREKAIKYERYDGKQEICTPPGRMMPSSPSTS